MWSATWALAMRRFDRQFFGFNVCQAVNVCNHKNMVILNFPFRLQWMPEERKSNTLFTRCTHTITNRDKEISMPRKSHELLISKQILRSIVANIAVSLKSSRQFLETRKKSIKGFFCATMSFTRRRHANFDIHIHRKRIYYMQY